ncbi:MAG: glycosyltransferase family 39 protein [Chloroflexota bacterium]
MKFDYNNIIKYSLSSRMVEGIALLIVLLGFVLLVHSANTTYITADEYLVYKFTRDDLGQSVSYLANRDVHPPLWFSFFWGWRRLVGDSDFAGRLQAILFSMMTLAFVFQLGKQWLRGRRFGIFAMIAVGVSGLFFRHSLEIRPYAFAMLLSSLSMIAFQRWLSLRTFRTAFVYAATVAMLFYVHYFLFLLVLIQGLYFLFFIRLNRQLWFQAIGAAGFAFLLFLPWFPNFLNQVRNLRTVEVTSGMARGLAGSGATTQPTSIVEVLNLTHAATNGLIWLYVPLMIFGAWHWWKKPSYRLALFWALAVPTAAFVLNLVIAVYTPRYIINFVLGLGVIVAAALGRIPLRFRWFSILCFASINLWAIPANLPHDIVPYKLLLTNLADAFRPGDGIFIDPPQNRAVEFNWEYSHIFTSEMKQAIVRTIDDAVSRRRVWYLTGDWFNPQIQATYKQIEHTHPRQGGFGDCNTDWCYLIQLMEAPSLKSPIKFGENMAFWGIDIDTVTHNTLQTRLWWRVEEAPSKDYSISLRLENKNGVLVSQADGPINHYGVKIINTSQLEPEQIYIDFRTLNLPSDLLPGEYSLSLIVYDWQTSERLLLPNGLDDLFLQTIQIH